MKWSGKTEI